jgi:beta-glucosidase
MSVEWFVLPETLYWSSKFFHERYKLPVAITENGVAARDMLSLDGRVHDSYRIDCMNRYLLQLERAVDEGIDVDAYLHWSVMDNFEWAQGYKERFGLIYVDYQTQSRILKDSAGWYRNVIETNGASLHAE